MQNNCKIDFLCSGKPTECSFYSKDTKADRMNYCKYMWLGFCVNDEAKEDKSKELFERYKK